MRDRDHHQVEEVEAAGGGDPVMDRRSVPPLLQMAGDKLIERFVPPRSEHHQPLHDKIYKHQIYILLRPIPIHPYPIPYHLF